MQILSSSRAPAVGTMLLRVQTGSILTPYFLPNRVAQLCVDGRVVEIDDQYFTMLNPDDEDDDIEHYVGILAGTDEEVSVLRESGYPVCDLRHVSLAEFVADTPACGKQP